MGGWLFLIVGGAAAAGFIALVRWLGKWHDPRLDSEQAQSEAFMWSQRTGSGGVGS